MSSKDSLGDRMKVYEEAARATLPRRLPVILRVDGKNFHTYTRGCSRPFDEPLGDVMIEVAALLCQEIQGAQIAYTQSDEISVLIHGYKKLTSDPWFDNQIQKMCSVAAGIASSTFTAKSGAIFERPEAPPTDVSDIRPAVFDARVFVVPENDVANYFVWRQQDAIRNSIQMLAQSMFSPKQLHEKNQSQLRLMCAEKNKDWGALPSRWRRGVCVRRELYEVLSMPRVLTGHPYVLEAVDSSVVPAPVLRSRWVPDFEIPLFQEDRAYIEALLAVEPVERAVGMAV